MPSYVPVSQSRFGAKGWLRSGSYSFCADVAMAPIVAAELGRAAPCMPLAFAEDAGAVRLVALLSLNPNTNLFVAPDGRWLVPYVPAAFRAYPFALRTLNNSPTIALCIDENAPVIVKKDYPGAVSFFDDNGTPTKELNDVLNFLAQIEENRKITQIATDCLVDSGVLTSWDINIQTPAGIYRVIGLQRIDEERLNSLSFDGFLKLRSVGALPIAYAQIISMFHIQSFDGLAKIKENLEKSQASIARAFGEISSGNSSDFMGFDLSKI